MYGKKLTRKRLVLSTLLIGIVIFSVVGCGNDDEKPDKPIVETAAPILTKEDILGTWEVVSINGLTSEAFLESPEGEDFEEISISLSTFLIVFSNDDSWKMNLHFESTLDFPDNPPDPELPPDGKLNIIGEWSGYYIIEDPKLFLTTAVADIIVISDPADYIQVATDYLTTEEAEADFDQAFRNEILKTFKQANVVLQGDKRTLVAPAAKKVVLKKQ